MIRFFLENFQERRVVIWESKWGLVLIDSNFEKETKLKSVSLDKISKYDGW